MRENIKIAMIGYTQLVFLSANTFSIASANLGMVFVSAIFTNMIFSYAVKSLAFSNWWNRTYYSVGAALGCVTGTFLASTIFKGLS
jgi:hypothetical protein